MLQMNVSIVNTRFCENFIFEEMSEVQVKRKRYRNYMLQLSSMLIAQTG